MTVVPEPSADDTPVHEAAAVGLEPGEKVTVTLSPSTSGSLHRIPIVAISKRSEATYEIEVDGTRRFGPVGLPPTDVDDLGVTFYPALRLRREMKITVRDVRETGNERRYLMHVIGWEA